MNTSALKSLAPAVRRQIMEAVTRKLDYVLTAQRPDMLTTFVRQVAVLRMLGPADRPGQIWLDDRVRASHLKFPGMLAKISGLDKMEED